MLFLRGFCGRGFQSPCIRCFILRRQPIFGQFLRQKGLAPPVSGPRLRRTATRSSTTSRACGVLRTAATRSRLRQGGRKMGCVGPASLFLLFFLCVCVCCVCLLACLFVSFFVCLSASLAWICEMVGFDFGIWFQRCVLSTSARTRGAHAFSVFVSCLRDVKAWAPGSESDFPKGSLDVLSQASQFVRCVSLNTSSFLG